VSAAIASNRNVDAIKSLPTCATQRAPFDRKSYASLVQRAAKIVGVTLLDQVIDESSSGDATSLLRKLLVLAHRLDAGDLKQWVTFELNGYPRDAELPAYRGPFAVPVQAQLSGMFGSSGSNMLSPHGMPPGFEDMFRVSFYDPLATLESLAASGQDLGSPWDPAMAGLYNQWADEGKVAHVMGMSVYSARRIVTPGLVRGVIDVVRTKALQLALDLQTDFPNAGEKDGPTVSDPDVNQAITHVTTNIYGSVGNIAQGSNAQQRAMVQVGDVGASINAARDYLADEALPQFLELLSNRDQTDSRSRVAKFIEAVRSGAVALAAGVASSVAADGLLAIASAFFGWS
jgi:hypothetical protein